MSVQFFSGRTEKFIFKKRKFTKTTKNNLMIFFVVENIFWGKNGEKSIPTLLLVYSSTILITFFFSIFFCYFMVSLQQYKIIIRILQKKNKKNLNLQKQITKFYDFVFWFFFFFKWICRVYKAFAYNIHVYRKRN